MNDLRKRMEGYGIEPNDATYQALLCCYGNHGDADGVHQTVLELQAYAENQVLKATCHITRAAFLSSVDTSGQRHILSYELPAERGV